MSKIEDFLNKSQEQDIIGAIQSAEKNTSGEIRIHIEKEVVNDPYERGLEVFHLLGMDETAHRNGVLIYIAVVSKKFAILGDQGIDEKVEDDFWNTEKELMLSHFKKNEFSEGICKVIHEIGQKLKTFFPYQSNDENELSDEISKG